MTRCAYCGKLILFGGFLQEPETFCNERCFERLHSLAAYPSFCPACVAMTSADSIGDTTTVHGIGTKLYGSKDECLTCGSIVQTLWWCVFFIPVLPIGKFRVKYLSPPDFMSRKVLAI